MKNSQRSDVERKILARVPAARISYSTMKKHGRMSVSVEGKEISIPLTNGTNMGGRDLKNLLSLVFRRLRDVGCQEV